VTYQRQNIFTDFILARIVVQAMRQQHQEQKVNSLAFVVMPDHFHWLIAYLTFYYLSALSQKSM
jgi:REP element-mobilizing transposase RayT